LIAISAASAAPWMRSSHQFVLLRPSKATDPSTTATKATVPDFSSFRISPLSGGRATTRPFRAANGARRAKSPKYALKPSPFANQSLRPKAAAPVHVIQL
jgi:hypothetical protein